jgi:hypothetical protein
MKKIDRLSLSLGTSLLAMACSSAPDIVTVSNEPRGKAVQANPDTTGAATASGPGLATTEFVVRTSSFTVAPGEEVYKCQDFVGPFGDESVGVVGTETELTTGSHHMFAFVMPNDSLSLFDTLQDCPNGGTEFHEYLATAGSPKTQISYADGVGRYFDASNGLRMNVHLFNAATEPVDAFIQLKVRAVDPALLEHRAASLFLNNLGLRIPPGESVQTASYTLPADIWLLGAASHMHKWGTHFEATTGEGTMLYQTDEWAEPKPTRFDPPLPLTRGTSISWSCHYANDTGSVITFGDSAIHNEMCILPGEFYSDAGTQISVQYPVR